MCSCKPLLYRLISFQDIFIYTVNNLHVNWWGNYASCTQDSKPLSCKTCGILCSCFWKTLHKIYKKHGKQVIYKWLTIFSREGAEYEIVYWIKCLKYQIALISCFTYIVTPYFNSKTICCFLQGTVKGNRSKSRLTSFVLTCRHSCNRFLLFL